MRADRVAEARLVVAALEPVDAAVLPVGPADRQVLCRLQVVVDDGAVRDDRPENTEAAIAERIDQMVERLRRNHDMASPGQADPPGSSSAWILAAPDTGRNVNSPDARCFTARGYTRVVIFTGSSREASHAWSSASTATTPRTWRT